MPKLSVDEIIRRAIQEGKFDDLPGKGKPLALDENPLADPEWRAAHHILKSGGFTLPWIESLREIEMNLEKVRADLARTWRWYKAADEKGITPSQYDAVWERSVDTFHEQIAELNKKIRSYNLEVPNERFQLHLVDVEKEIERIKISLD